MKRILLVEDEQVMAKNISFFLEKEGYHVDVSYDGEQALLMFAEHTYDLLLLDWTLPKKDGLEVCRQIRKQSSVPIMMITAKGEIMDKVIGLEVGADDYIVKPFHQREMLARIHALWRRQDRMDENLDKSDQPLIRYESLELNKDQMIVRCNDEQVALTVNEFKLLLTMLQQPQRVFEREALYEHVWGDSVGFSDRTVDVNISRLRKKLLELTGQKYLHAVRNIGYRFGGSS